ncbi:MAG: uracil-DNA glycosylase family protein [Candidatus Dojkabacteria bacterium]|jgi:uracil-DNA glycosylase
MTKEKEVLSVFTEIYNLNVCGEDPLKIYRDISKTNVNSKVMIIAEAMAPKQVRLSGVNYFYKDGRIGSTGKYLEKFLNLFNHSVYPNHPNCVYHTEIVHNFPGYIIKNGKRNIRRPNSEEIKKSVESGILQKEIEIIEPKLILLMGNTAYTTFYTHFLKQKLERNLSEEIEKISLTGIYKKYKDIPVIPIQHSSGANPRFSKFLKNNNLLEIIKRVLI